MKTTLTVFTAALLSFCCSTSFGLPLNKVACGHETLDQQEAIYHTLNFGFSWFADENHVSYCQQEMTPEYFSNAKPRTLIFVHGWAPLSTMSTTRFNFNANDIQGPSSATDMVEQWLMGGSGDKKPWNVGVFYWNQFADVLTGIDPDAMLPSVRSVEAKIWRLDGPDAMNWSDSDGVSWNSQNFLPKEDQNKNVAELFRDRYIAALTPYAQANPTAEIRLVGESLGSQLVLHAVRLIDDVVKQKGLPASLVPKQVVLLDPIVTDAQILKNLTDPVYGDIPSLERDGVVISGYRTSRLGKGFDGITPSNSSILNLGVFSELDPCIYAQSDDQHRHTAGIWWYLLSYNLPAVPLKDDEKSSAPFANSPANMLKKWMDPKSTGFESADLQTNDECKDLSKMDWLAAPMQKVPKTSL